MSIGTLWLLLGCHVNSVLLILSKLHSFVQSSGLVQLCQACLDGHITVAWLSSVIEPVIWENCCTSGASQLVKNILLHEIVFLKCRNIFLCKDFRTGSIYRGTWYQPCRSTVCDSGVSFIPCWDLYCFKNLNAWHSICAPPAEVFSSSFGSSKHLVLCFLKETKKKTLHPKTNQPKKMSQTNQRKKTQPI